MGERFTHLGERGAVPLLGDWGLVRRRLIMLTVSALSLGWVLAPSAAAQYQWSDPQPVSQGTDNAEVPQVAIANDGRAVMVWRQEDGCRPRLWAAYRERGGPLGGRFSAPEAISVPGAADCGDRTGDVSEFDLDMNARGDAIVVFRRVDIAGSGPGRIHGIRSAFAPAGGKFSATDNQVVMSGSVQPRDTGTFWEPRVAIDGSGVATAIYHGPPEPFGGFGNQSVYNSKVRGAGPGGFWSGSTELLPHPDTSGEFASEYNETGGTIASNEQGDRLAGLTQHRDDPDGERGTQAVHASQRNAGASTWSDLGPADYPAHGPDLAADGITTSIRAGAVTLGWREGNRIYGSHEAGPQLLAADNVLFYGFPSRPQFDLDASGNALGLWSLAGGIYGAYSGRGGASGFDPVDNNPVPGDETTTDTSERPRSKPHFSTGRSDMAAAVFEEVCGPAPADPTPTRCSGEGANGDQVVRAALRLPGNKSKFGAPEIISQRGSLEPDDTQPDQYGNTKTATGPRIAVNANGEGVAVWSQGSGSGSLVVQAALLTPTTPTASGETIPLPGPAPPPPPPRPTQIELAREIKSGEAVVLRANVTGPVTSLEWTFGTKGEPKIVATAGPDGRVPVGVRLRHPNRSFTARVTAKGPGGSRTFSRSLFTPNPPDSREAKKVLSGLNKSNAAGVFAVGDPGVLADGASAARASRRKRGPKAKASASCSPLAIYSGQQKVTGCFKPIEQLADIPAREKGAVRQLADSLKLDGNDLDQMKAATKLTDAYVSEGKATLNDKFPVTPSQASSLVSMPQADTLFSAKADLPVGGASYSPSGGMNLKLDPAKATIPLNKMPKPPKLPKLAGLEIVGDWDVTLDKQEAKIKASVKLPPSITKAGVQISNQVNLRATPDRVIVDEVRVGPTDVNVAALKVNKFQIHYKRQNDEWEGQGKACLIGTACLDMIPPAGGVTIKNGELGRAGATLGFPPPGIPLWSGVNLERVSFGLGLRPTRIFGGARIGVASLLKLNGGMFVAFPTSQDPFVLDRKEVGNGYPAHLYGSRFNGFTLGASAEALVMVPVIGETKLGGAYVIYEYPGYMAFGGGYDVRVLDLLGIRGGISAESDVDRGAYDIHGEVKACLYLIGLDLCQGAAAHVSRGPGGTGGAGACVDLGLVSVGGGVKWRDLSDPYLWPIDGCKWSPFRIQVRQSTNTGARVSANRLVRSGAGVSRAVRARESQVGVRAPGTYTIKIEKDKPNPVLRLDGAGTAPSVRVSGPGGVLEAPSEQGFAKSADGTMRIMRFKNQYANITSVGFQGAKPGVYTVQTLPGSARVVNVQQATDPPDAKVTGKVTGKGRKRVLTYEVRKRAGQKVVFRELAGGGASKVIGSTTRARGRIAFRPAPGRGRRTVIAQFELSGMPAERKRVTTFKPQSPVMPRVRGVKLSRKGARLRVSWKKVAGATAYEVAVTPRSRRMVFARTRGRRASLKVPGWDSGRVTVRAVDGLRQSPPAGRRFKAVSKRPSAFRSFPKCKVTKKKINCGKKKTKVRAKAKAKKKKARRGR